MPDIVIKAENLGKSYIIGHQAEISGGYLALRDVLVQNLNNFWHKTKDLVQGKPIIQGATQEEFWALKDVSFEIQRGETIGIIGRNGAGKSTLLKILSRITEPSTGRVTIKGRVSSLLEVGTGFHPELTGRENIYLNGAILGMTRAEVKRKFDEIVDFSGVEHFLDTPVKRYSSGMYVRLAFAVAAHLEPEILVVDEVLAVGDAEFQKKCLGKMGEVAGEGRTVLFVSHNMAAIKSLCNQSILIDQGILLAIGNTEEIVAEYIMPRSRSDSIVFRPLIPQVNNGIVINQATLIFDGEVLHNEQELIFQLQIMILKKLQFSVHMFVYRENELAFIASDYHAPVAPDQQECGKYVVQFTIPSFLLNPGYHSIGVVFSDYNGNGYHYLNAKDLIRFNLEDNGYRRNKRYNLGWGGAVSPLLPISMKKQAYE